MEGASDGMGESILRLLGGVAEGAGGVESDGGEMNKRSHPDWLLNLWFWLEIASIVLAVFYMLGFLSIIAIAGLAIAVSDEYGASLIMSGFYWIGPIFAVIAGGFFLILIARGIIECRTAKPSRILVSVLIYAGLLAIMFASATIASVVYWIAIDRAADWSG